MGESSAIQRACVGLALWASVIQQLQQQVLFVSGRVQGHLYQPPMQQLGLLHAAIFSVLMALLPEHCWLSALLVVRFSLGDLSWSIGVVQLWALWSFACTATFLEKAGPLG